MLGQFLVNALRPKSPTMVSNYEANPYGEVGQMTQNLSGAQNALLSALGAGPNLQAPPQYRQPSFGTPQILASVGLEVLNQIFNKGRDPGAGLAGVLGGMNQRAGMEYQNALAQTEFANKNALMRDERNLRGLEFGVNQANQALGRSIDFEQDRNRRMFQEKQAELQRQYQEREWNRQLEQDRLAAKRHEDQLKAQGMNAEADRLSALMKSLESQVKEGAVEVVKGLTAELGMPEAKAKGYIEQAMFNKDIRERETKAKETEASFNIASKQRQLGFEEQRLANEQTRIGLEQQRINIQRDEKKAKPTYSADKIATQKQNTTKSEAAYRASDSISYEDENKKRAAKEKARADWAKEWYTLKNMTGVELSPDIVEWITPDVVKNPDLWLQLLHKQNPNAVPRIAAVLRPILKDKELSWLKSPTAKAGSLKAGQGPNKAVSPTLQGNIPDLRKKYGY